MNQKRLFRYFKTSPEIIRLAVMYYLWRAIDQQGEVLEAYVSTRRNKTAVLTFLRKALSCYGNPEGIVTDRCPSYAAALRDLNNLCELSHQPSRPRERAMQGFRRLSM